MTKSRAWSAGAAVLAVLMMVGAWFVLIAPQRSEAASLRDQTTQQQQFNEQVKLKTAQLKAQFASLPARQAQLAEIKQEMPDNPALPSLVRDLSSYADDAGVQLTSVAPAAPQPLSNGAATSTASAAATAPIQQIQTTIVANGSYSELTLYLQKLQSKMRRAVLIENLALTPVKGEDAKPDELQLTIIGKVFVLDSASATQAAAAASGTKPTTSNVN